jgi:hypothetical protein
LSSSAQIALAVGASVLVVAVVVSVVVWKSKKNTRSKRANKEA